MSERPFLALYAAPDWRGEDALELLRVVAALVACGHAVRLEQTSSVLTADDLPDEAERILEQLAAFGVVPRPYASAPPADLRSILRLGAADRSGTPALAVVVDGTDLQAVEEAGQVVLSDVAY